MFGLGWGTIALLVLFFVVIPAVGIAVFGLLTMLLWRAVGRARTARLEKR